MQLKVNFDDESSDEDEKAPVQSKKMKAKECLINEQYGDNMEEFEWDAQSDSDEEVPELTNLKIASEIRDNIHLSKNGLKQFIDNLCEYESAANKENPKNAKLWESKAK